jgi:hypothetical protein
VSAARKARIAGVLYLIIFIAAPSGAATATPAKLSITLACDTGVAIIFYVLFRAVSRNLSLVAVAFRLIFIAIMAINSLNYFGIVNLWNAAHSARVFNNTYILSIAPFGVHCLLIGYLIYRSTFLPRFLGVLMALAGLAYLTFVFPSLINRISPYILIPGVIGEGALTLWLLIGGVNTEKWNGQAAETVPEIKAI